MSLLVCPDCGCKSFSRRVPMRGFWLESLGPNGDGDATEVVESTTDELVEREQPATIRCDGCGKRLPNPKHL